MKKNKLPKRFKDRWVKALTSGKYEQGRTQFKIHSYDGEIYHCCLGVAAEICEIKIEEGQGTFDRNIKSTLKKGIPKLLIGQAHTNPIIEKLIRFNDREGKSFKWIAAYIKRYL